MDGHSPICEKNHVFDHGTYGIRDCEQDSLEYYKYGRNKIYEDMVVQKKWSMDSLIHSYLYTGLLRLSKYQTRDIGFCGKWKTGWWFQPLWKIWKSIGFIIPDIWKNKIHVPNHQPENADFMESFLGMTRDICWKPMHGSPATGDATFPAKSTNVSFSDMIVR